MGTRNAGSDNDSYFDEMFVRLNLNGESCEQYTAVGIEDSYLNKGVRVFPNPSNEQATIEVLNPKRSGSYHIQLFNLEGREMYSGQSVSGKFSINCQEFSEGMYFFRVSNEDWSSSGKFIVN
jgi:hypothetical protein